MFLAAGALRSSTVQPPVYKEGIQFGMISWFVPLSTYPAGYGGNPKGEPLTLSLKPQR
jgi:hypothetical protein